jgi:hypothetical protein
MGMKIKSIVIGLAIVMSNLSTASSLTPGAGQADSFMITYRNHTNGSYTYSTNPPLHSSKAGFDNLENWSSTGQLATMEKITFTGTLDNEKDLHDEHRVKIMFKNNGTGQEHVFELENPANDAAGPQLHYYFFANGKAYEVWQEKVRKQNGHYAINIELVTDKQTGLDIVLDYVTLDEINALDPKY